MKKFNRTFLKFSFVLPIIIGTILPRFFVLGGYPGTDEGYYLFQAQIFSNNIEGNYLSDSRIYLYPYLIHWIFDFQLNPFLATRVLDCLFASIATFIFYKIILFESKSILAAVIITTILFFLLNQPLFIGNGFKNSIFIAMIPLFSSLWCALVLPDKEFPYKWFLIGFLITLAIFLRESFALYMLLGGISVLISFGFKKFNIFLIGIIVTVTSFLAFIFFERGELVPLFNEYLINQPQIFSAIYSKSILYNFLINGPISFYEGLPLIILGFFGFLLFIYNRIKKISITNPYKIIFWIMLSIIPLCEPIFKIGLPYHFSICFIGIAGLVAVCWREASRRNYILYKYFIFLILCFLLFTRFSLFQQNIYQTNEVLKNFQSYTFPNTFNENSLYLLAAEKVKKITPIEGTLSISGFMHSIYPLSGLLPPQRGLIDLTATFIRSNFSISTLINTIKICPSNTILISNKSKNFYGNELVEAIRGTNIYKELGEVPKSNKGTNFQILIFQLKDNNYECKL